jgi:hypothetical protein
MSSGFTAWGESRLTRLFEHYDLRFWSGRLSGWSVIDSEECAGLYGQCDPTRKLILVRLRTHDSDFEVRATVVHEMAHAASSLGHDEEWHTEIMRLKALGAPTNTLDLLVPYDEMRSLVTSFIDAARSDACSGWREASYFLAYDLIDARGNPKDEGSARRLQICKRFFEMERKRSERNQRINGRNGT